ncbi:MAG: MaoC/PaaZ C-terminal domain-containing protein [Sphingomicrobium sp.]
MTFDPERLISHRFPTVRQSYDRRDTILYALGIGLGLDPLDEYDLDYLLETREAILPAFAVTLASPGMWIRDTAFGVDFARLVHSAQAACFHRSLPTKGTVTSSPRIASIYDRGEGRGALVVLERDVTDADNGECYAHIEQTLLLRGDGGFDGKAPPIPPAQLIPDRVPDKSIQYPISPRAALIYRLSGDWNPLHAAPAAARAAGFERPILHGLASFGWAAYAIERLSGRKLTSIECRFSGTVVPGDTLSLSAWFQDDSALFSASTALRPALDRGVATFTVP